MAFWLSRSSIAGLYDVLIDLIAEVKRMSDTLQSAIDDLKQAVTAANTEKDSVIALINGIPDLIKHAGEDASSKGATPEQLQALHDLASQLQSQTAEFQAAVTANTPAAGGASPITNGGNPTANTGTVENGGTVANTDTVSPAGQGATGPVNPSSTFDETGQPTGPGSSPPVT